MKRSLFKITIPVVSAPMILAAVAIHGAHAEEPPKPDLFTVAAYDIGASGYNQPMGVMEGVLEEFGIRSRLLPLSNNLARMRAAMSGQVDYFVTSTDAVFARRGWYEWADAEWGPQQIRLIWQTNRTSSFTIATRGDSDIETIDDLEGMRVSYLLGSPSGNAITEAYLNFEGLTWDDVEAVEVAGYAEAWEALAQGDIDAAGGSTMNTTFQQMAAGPYGIRYLELPYSEDHPGWEYFQEVYPTIFPAEISLAAGLEEGESLQIFSFPFPSIMAYDDVDDSSSYWLLKSVTESYDEFKDISPEVADWTLERSLEIPLKLAPLHEGAVNYLKSAGKWTEEMQQAQDELLEEDAAYANCWEEAVAARDEGTVGADDWPDFWKDYAEENCGLPVSI